MPEFTSTSENVEPAACAIGAARPHASRAKILRMCRSLLVWMVAHAVSEAFGLRRPPHAGLHQSKRCATDFCTKLARRALRAGGAGPFAHHAGSRAVSAAARQGTMARNHL